MKHSRKGQAAFEYLITYGWAFLVILATVGVLAYFGLLNPQRYIPDSCEFGEQLKCVDFVITNEPSPGTNGVIVLRMRNNFEQNIEITNVFDQENALTLDTPNIVIPKGDITRVTINIADTAMVLAGSKDRYQFNIEFRREGGTIPHNVTGTVFAEVADYTVIGPI